MRYADVCLTQYLFLHKGRGQNVGIAVEEGGDASTRALEEIVELVARVAGTVRGSAAAPPAGQSHPGVVEQQVLDTLTPIGFVFHGIGGSLTPRSHLVLATTVYSLLTQFIWLGKKNRFHSQTCLQWVRLTVPVLSSSASRRISGTSRYDDAPTRGSCFFSCECL